MHNRNNKLFLLKFLEENKINFQTNVELKKKSWLKAGGTFETYIQPNTYSQVLSILHYLKKISLNFYVVGNLSNVIFRDGIIRTPIINIKNIHYIETQEEKNSVLIKTGCGVSIFKFVNYICNKLNITGLEGLIGIPGSIGGAIVMNASSYNSYISEYLMEIKIINEKNEKEIIKKKDLELDWRSSIFLKRKKIVIIEAVFEFPKKNLITQSLMEHNINKIKHHRKTFQEKYLPNLGSLFATKNLYKDISKSSLIFKTMYIVNRIVTKLILKFFHEYHLVKYRKISVKIYSYFLGIESNSPFKLSDRTINCLTNNGSSQANKAIDIIRKIQKNINYAQKLENIIIDKIN